MLEYALCLTLTLTVIFVAAAGALPVVPPQGADPQGGASGLAAIVNTVQLLPFEVHVQ